MQDTRTVLFFARRCFSHTALLCLCTQSAGAAAAASTYTAAATTLPTSTASFFFNRVFSYIILSTLVSACAFAAFGGLGSLQVVHGAANFALLVCVDVGLLHLAKTLKARVVAARAAAAAVATATAANRVHGSASTGNLQVSTHQC
jgi:hypothetical protein